MNKGNQKKSDSSGMKIKDYPDVMDIGEMCCLLQISKKTGYQLLRDKRIESMKVGREYRIPKINVLRYLKIAKRVYSRKNEL